MTRIWISADVSNFSNILVYSLCNYHLHYYNNLQNQTCTWHTDVLFPHIHIHGDKTKVQPPQAYVTLGRLWLPCLGHFVCLLSKTFKSYGSPVFWLCTCMLKVFSKTRRAHWVRNRRFYLRVTQSLVFCVMFCRSLFVILSFFFWPLCCLFFFDLQILIIPLVS
jgi:hypothetical protein